MCLYINKKLTTSKKKKGGLIKCWKVLHRSTDKKGRIRLKSIYNNFYWKVGYNIAKGFLDTDYFDRDYVDAVTGGAIHIYLDKPFINLSKKSVLVEILANIDDLIAYGNHGDATFKKVFLTKDEFQSAKIPRKF